MDKLREKRKRYSQRSKRIEVDDDDLEHYLQEEDNLETFLRARKDQYDKIEASFKEHYTEKLKSKCPKEMWKRAYTLVNSVFSFQRRQEDRDVDPTKEYLVKFDDPELCEVVKNVIEEYTGLYEDAFLLLNVPKTGRFSYIEEKEARDHQFQDFCKTLLGRQNTVLFPVTRAEIRSYEEILEELDRFMEFVATQSKCATVVFNGHGTSRGCLVLEDDNENDHSIDDFLRDIHERWDKFHKTEKLQETETNFPASVTVVLAQCYSNVFSREDKPDVIKIVSLTKDGSPLTEYTLWRRPDGRISTSIHHQLHEYAVVNRKQPLYNGENNVTNNTKSDFQESTLETFQLSASTSGLQASASEYQASASPVSESDAIPDIQNDYFIPSLFAWIHLTRSYEMSEFIKLLKIATNEISK